MIGGQTVHTATVPAKSLDADDLGELARILQAHTALCELSDMQVRGALELMQQRGWRIVKVDAEQVHRPA